MHNRRRLERFYAIIEGIEPRSKNGMSASSKAAFQTALADQMRGVKRRSYRGPLALELKLGTTDRNPAHLHTIAKNLLDLLGPPLSALPEFRNGLLYGDDKQVKILSVSAAHGKKEAYIYLEAANLNAFVEDIALAGGAELKALERREEYFEDENPIERLAHSLERADVFAERFGAEGFDAILFVERWDAQQYLLSRSPLLLYQLHHLFGYRGPGARQPAEAYRDFARNLENQMGSSAVRVRLGELPSRSGDSSEYRVAVEKAVAAFRSQYAWILNPLLVPLAIEIAVKPTPQSRLTNINDLDNVARNFLIPAVVEEFQPPSDLAWVGRVHRQAETNAKVAAVWGERRRHLPPSARIGITRYDIIEIPRDEHDDTPGYVILSITADPVGYTGIFNRVDAAIEDLREEISEAD